MKSNQLKKKLGGAVLAFSMLLGTGVASSITTQAQSQDDRRQDDQGRGRRNRDDRNQNRRARRGNDGYGNYGGSNDLRQTALNEGFNEGLKQGRNDRKHGDYENYSDEKEYQKGTKSYSSRLGDRETYRRYFREAFSHGYADGYAGY